MNKDLELVLRLQELELLRKRLELAGSCVEEPGFDFLDTKIERVRRQLPGSVVSKYDALKQKSPDIAAAIFRDTCHACGEQIPSRVILLVDRSNQLLDCPYCGRFLYSQERAPDYIALV